MDIGRAWEVIERVLRDELPEAAATLRPPVTDAAVDRLAEVVGRELPEDLVASLRIHDGQDNPSRLLDVFDHQTFLSVDEMIADHTMRAEVLGDDVDADEYDWMTPDRVRTIPNCQGWLRFTDCEGRGYAVDLDPLAAGAVGQVIWLPIDGPTPEPEADSYGRWFTELAGRFEAGGYSVNGIGGLWLES